MRTYAYTSYNILSEYFYFFLYMYDLYYLLQIFTWKAVFQGHTFLSIYLLALSRLCILFPHHVLKDNYSFIVCMLTYIYILVVGFMDQ